MKTLLLYALLTAPAAAQLAGSAGFQLVDESFGGAGGPLASAGYAAFFELPGLADDPIASVSYSAELGFLWGADPLAETAPVVFGVAPSLGPKAGGTSITVAGWNLAPPGGTTLTIGGQFASSTFVASGTQLTAIAPPGGPGTPASPGPMGPADVAATTAGGTATLAGGFVYTPAVVASPGAMVSGSIELVNASEAGMLFSTSWSPFATQIPLGAWGNLLIGPALTFEVLQAVPYPAPDGVHTALLPVPSDPGLAGLVLYFQSASIGVAPTLTVQLTNRSSTLLQ